MPCNSGNSDYANSVYGGLDQQTAASGQGNLIQMNNPNGGLTGGNARLMGGSEMPELKQGGRRHKGKKGRHGGVGLGNVLVPAALVLGSNLTYRKLRGNKKGKSARRGRGFRPFSRYLSGGTGNVGSSPEVTGYAGSSALSPASFKGGNGDAELPKTGGNVSDGPGKEQHGGTTFVDIAVPAGLVYANDRYYNRKARGKTNRRRPRRNRRRTRGGRSFSSSHTTR